jgi:hypothetical protein
MSVKQFQWIRTNTLKLGESVDGTGLTEVPKGFNNNILWNLGHLFVTAENLVFKASGRETQLSAAYTEAFGGGTSPKTWTTEPPAKEEILSKLSEQAKRLSDTFEGHLEEALPNVLTIAGIDMKTVGDLLDFATVHETMHFTTMRLYSTLLKQAD